MVVIFSFKIVDHVQNTLQQKLLSLIGSHLGLFLHLLKNKLFLKYFIKIHNPKNIYLRGIPCISMTIRG